MRGLADLPRIQRFMGALSVKATREARLSCIAREGKLSFFHYDLYAQALAKIERCHSQDVADV